jgi:hypothetical protein
VSLTLPTNSRGPILDLTLPESGTALEIVLRNKTTGRTLTINLPAAWAGDDLSLDFFRRTIKDQSGADRSALLSATDNELWSTAPLIAGANDVAIEVLTPVLSTTKSPGTITQSVLTTGLSEKEWENPNNVKASDNVRALVELSKVASYYLKATNYGFGLPVGGTIVGLEPAAERSRSGAGGAVADAAVRIIKGGTIKEAERKSVVVWPTADAVQSYGGTTDLFGEVWTPADINSANFGWALAVTRAEALAFAQVDHMPITVYYRAAPSAYVATAALRWEKGYF